MSTTPDAFYEAAKEEHKKCAATQTLNARLMLDRSLETKNN